jgi:hypothetical protein
MAVGGVAGPFSSQARALPAIVVGGLIVGTLDLLYAVVVYSRDRPILVPQTIASGLLGAQAYDGGIKTAALGIVLHFVIALGAATIYYLASRRIGFLTEHAVVSGVVFGALVYCFMHFVVLPFSNVPPGNTPLIYKIAEFVEHWFGVGLPISLSVRHYSRRA